ncbi:MAG: FAD:protein FMN transferase [Thermoanaerobaculales bacterium]|nr:FAD:protein FMN transferase [Thermoanaerobaculales bacterium]
MLPGLFVAALLAVLVWRTPRPEPGGPVEWVLTGPTMGTAYTIKLVAPGGGTEPPAALSHLVEGELEAVNRAMSTYLPDSELERLNRHELGPFAATAPLLEVVAAAQRVADLSGGAFDVTVRPLVDAWGFGPAGAAEAPDDELVGQLLATIGFRFLTVDLERGEISKARPQLRVDLSAIAKGYGVDRVAAALEAAGHLDYMVEVGGEVRARGRNRRGEVWRIGIERPDELGREVHTVIPLADLALATSGDYRNFRVLGGRRVSHTIDPRVGRPIAHNLASVSVVDPSCMTADAWATALEVLGPAEGPALADRLELAALFLVREAEGQYRELRSAAWAAHFEMEQPAAGVSK